MRVSPKEYRHKHTSSRTQLRPCFKPHALLPSSSRLSSTQPSPSSLPSSTPRPPLASPISATLQALAALAFWG
eukprot:357281-Rhodomonas_salina.1